MFFYTYNVVRSVESTGLVENLLNHIEIRSK